MGIINPIQDGGLDGVNGQWMGWVKNIPPIDMVLLVRPGENYLAQL